MTDITKALLTILAMIAVMVYTVFNYISSNIDTTYFLVFMAILCFPLINMVNLIIRELKNK